MPATDAVYSSPATLRTPDGILNPDSPAAAAIRVGFANVAIRRHDIVIPDNVDGHTPEGDAELDRIAHADPGRLAAAREEWLDVLGALGVIPGGLDHEPGRCRRPGCHKAFPISSTSPTSGNINTAPRRGFCSVRCEAAPDPLDQGAAPATSRPGAPMPAEYRWRYTRGGRTRHVVAVVAESSVCGVGSTEGHIWLGTGSDRERARLSGLPPCSTCVGYLPKATTWEVAP
jgi:hypothetical protein